MNDSFDLNRFIKAQEIQYAKAFHEIKTGKKKTHWIWYVFPQIIDLGTSNLSRKYALKSKNEVKAYYEHPILGKRLKEVCNLLVEHENKSILEIFGHPEYLKIFSSISLFHIVIKK